MTDKKDGKKRLSINAMQAFMTRRLQAEVEALEAQKAAKNAELLTYVSGVYHAAEIDLGTIEHLGGDVTRDANAYFEYGPRTPQNGAAGTPPASNPPANGLPALEGGAAS